MKEKRTPLTKVEVNERIRKRATNAKIAEYTYEVAILLTDGHSKPDIEKIISKKFNKNKGSCRKYIEEATRLIQQEYEQDLDIVRFQKIKMLESKITHFHKKAQQREEDDDFRNAQIYYKLALEYQVQVSKYYPNELKPDKAEQDSPTIAVTYKVVEQGEIE